MTGNDLIETGGMDDAERLQTPSPGPSNEPTTLHEILQQEKQEFEAKMERSARKKRWLLGKYFIFSYYSFFIKLNFF